MSPRASSALLSPFLLSFVALTHVPPLGAQSLTTVSGRIIDEETDEVVTDVEVVLQELGLTSVTNPGGVFRFQAVPPGRYHLVIRHLAYGEKVREVEVQEGVPLSLQIGISREAIELRPLTVQVYSQRDLRLRASGVKVGGVGRTELDQAQVAGMHLGDVLRAYIPSVLVQENPGIVGLPICVEFRGSRFGGFDGLCRSPALYLDGLPVNNPTYLYRNLSLQDIKRLEVVPPSEAGARFGTGALWGALVIETRTPGIEDEEGEKTVHFGPLSVRAFDWSLEPRPHNWRKTFAFALLGNAVGLAIGVPIASRCIEVAAPAFDRVTTECGTWATMGSAIAGVVFPAVGTSLGARLGGRTEFSRGDFMPSAIAAVMALIPGYAVEVSSRRSDWERTAFAAKVILTVGVPAAVTFADHLFRSVREAP